jgi:hypothetical protein
MRHVISPPLSAILLLALASKCQAVPIAGPNTADDERFLESVGISTRGPDLLKFFQKLTFPAARVLKPEEIVARVRRLGDRNFKIRSEAANELMRQGPAALPELERAARDRDPEVRRGVGQCIDHIRQFRGGRPALAAARLLRMRQPPGTAAVLLKYLPFAENEIVEVEVLRTLLYPGIHAGTVDPALLAALKSELPACRAGAALVLGRVGNEDERGEVRKLLADADPKVRLRAVQGLWPTRDKRLIPVLIALLGEESSSVTEQAEDLLLRAAGDRTPRVALGEGAAARRRCRRAWETWWKANAESLDLDRDDLDTRAFNPALRVRTLTQQFLAALRAGDTAGLRDVTDVPFIVNGIEGLTSQAEFDHFLDELRREMVQQPKLRPAVKNVVRIEEYLRVAPRREQTILAELSASETHAVVYVSEVRVVHVQLPRHGRLEDLVFFVRVAGDRLWLMGVGDGRLAESR